MRLRTSPVALTLWLWLVVVLIALSVGLTCAGLRLGATEWWPPQRWVLSVYGLSAFVLYHVVLAGAYPVIVPWLARFWPRVAHYQLMLTAAVLTLDVVNDVLVVAAHLPPHPHIAPHLFPTPIPTHHR